MDIPEDVVTLILARLPVQSLLRFRCVCKAWRDLIGSRRFIDTHLQRGSPNKYLIIKRFDTRDESTKLSYYCRDEDGDESLGKAALDFEDFPTTTMFSGACNGICLVCANNPSDLDENPLYLLNPAIRELRKIPDRPFGKQRARPSTNQPGAPPYECKRIGAGFGYDHRTNDYKVVSIMLFLEDHYYTHTPAYGSCKIEIYSVSSNSWRVADTVCPTIYPHPEPGMEDHPIHPRDLSMDFAYGRFGEFICGLFLNGSIHWKADGHETVILAFNISDEVMQVFRLPRGITGYENSFPRSLFLLEDSLAFVQCVGDGDYGPITSFYVWVMVEYGDEESWIRRFYLQPGINMDVLAAWDDMLICETEEGQLASCNLQEGAPHHFRKHHHIKRDELREEPYPFGLYPSWKMMAAFVMREESLVRLRN